MTTPTHTALIEKLRAEDLKWRCHTPNLLREILENETTWALKAPLQIFGGILAEVAERAIELDDPKLHLLMMRLTLYENSDPEKTSWEEIRKTEDALLTALSGGGT